MRPRGMMLNPFSLSRERRTRLLPESNTSCAMRPPIISELNGKEGVADPVANLGKGHPTNEAIPGVADAKRARAAVLGNEDGSGIYVCLCVCPLFLKNKLIASGSLGPPVIFSDNIEHIINIITKSN